MLEFTLVSLCPLPWYYTAPELAERGPSARWVRSWKGWRQRVSWMFFRLSRVSDCRGPTWCRHWWGLLRCCFHLSKHFNVFVNNKSIYVCFFFLLRSSTSSATKWSKSISMPFLTTPTLNRHRLNKTSLTHPAEVSTHAIVQSAAFSQLRKFFCYFCFSFEQRLIITWPVDDGINCPQKREESTPAKEQGSEVGWRK